MCVSPSIQCKWKVMELPHNHTNVLRHIPDLGGPKNNKSMHMCMCILVLFVWNLVKKQLTDGHLSQKTIFGPCKIGMHLKSREPMSINFCLICSLLNMRCFGSLRCRKLWHARALVHTHLSVEQKRAKIETDCHCVCSALISPYMQIPKNEKHASLWTIFFHTIICVHYSSQ